MSAPHRVATLYRQELLGLGLSEATISEVESLCRANEYTNVERHRTERFELHRMLHMSGLPTLAGKRTKANVMSFVEDVTAVLVKAGLPFRTSEDSPLIRALAAIASSIDLPGDPRNAARSLHKAGGMTFRDRVKIAIVAAAFSRALLGTSYRTGMKMFDDAADIAARLREEIMATPARVADRMTGISPDAREQCRTAIADYSEAFLTEVAAMFRREAINAVNPIIHRYPPGA